MTQIILIDTGAATWATPGDWNNADNRIQRSTLRSNDMTQYSDENKGVLFKNDKEGNEKRPDYTGRINVGGHEYELAAWIRTPDAGGAKFMSLNVQEPRERQQSATPQERQAQQQPSGLSSFDDFDDDIPF